MASLSFGSQSPSVPHLSTGEVGDLRGDIESAFVKSDGRVGFPFISRVPGGMGLSLAGVPITCGVVGSGFLQGQSKATLTAGTGTSSLAFTANRPGTPGNSISVAVVAGSGSLSVGVVGQAITVTLAAGGSTANAVKAAVDAHATAKTLVQVVSGGTGSVAALAATNLSGGTGAGFEVKINGIEQQVVGSLTDTALPLVVSDLTGCAATDAAILRVSSNGVVSNAVALGVVA
jgi:hypothetical protein